MLLNIFFLLSVILIAVSFILGLRLSRLLSHYETTLSWMKLVQNFIRGLPSRGDGTLIVRNEDLTTLLEEIKQLSRV